MRKSSILISLLLVTGAAVNAAPAPVTDVNNGTLEQRVDALERMVNTRANMQHQMQQQLDTMQEEVAELRGTLEVHNHQLEQILTRQRELYLEIDKRVEALKSAAPTTTAPVAAVTQPDAQPAMTMDENSAYDRAVNLILEEKRYDEAIPEFQTFLQNFPNSSYAANAHYWLGQLLFNKQQWGDAASHFESVVNNYQDSSKHADAILKLGMVEQRRGNLARAEQLFQQVMSQYPDSSSSRLAETRLQAVRQGG
ncbi:tol-pal system protein YbgF [Aestuariibacter salexigens]|uniref:tol-pal system protein YbgF n=1 Tax=Aestuariibacter salexigens TaxID=226010 RepID=UPI000414834A|nr:tol-pal system protein YbgF [Aestuariibacter salexigens]